MYKSYYPKASEIERKWVLVDADGQNLGRIATRIAHVLLGKHKPTFTPGVEMGDYVVVINAEKVTVTGTKTSTLAARSVREKTTTPMARARANCCQADDHEIGSKLNGTRLP